MGDKASPIKWTQWFISSSSYIHYVTLKHKAGSLKVLKVTSDDVCLSVHVPHTLPTMLGILLVICYNYKVVISSN